VIEFQPDGANGYRVTGKVTNVASAPAASLRARLTASNCTVVGDKEKSLGASLAAGKTQTASVSWQVQPTANKNCQLKLEVVAAYAIPDLQYTQVERTFSPEHVDQVNKPKPPTELAPGCSNPNYAACNHPQPVAPPKPETPGGPVTYHGK